MFFTRKYESYCMIALFFIKITNLNSGRSDQKQARRDFIKMDEKIRNTAYNSCIAYDIKFWGWVRFKFRFSCPTIIWLTCFEFGIWTSNGLQFAFCLKRQIQSERSEESGRSWTNQNVIFIKMNDRGKWVVLSQGSCEPGTLKDFSWNFISRYNLYGEYDKINSMDITK